AQTLAGCDTDGDQPLVIVAAPAGGVRAAYWAASALEALFPTECARRNLFAVSGVSGGSVGTTLWTAHHGTAVSSEELVNQLSGDEALASALAGMFLRDLPQPLTGITDSWRDRAALMEDGWIEQTGVLGTVDSPLMWPDLALPGNWNPVLVLNSSSVTEGCRILISNVDQLTSESPAGCLSAPGPSSSFNSNSVSRAAIDPLPMASADSCDSRAPLAVSAALLSARFPLVTPSGSVHYCSGDSPRVTYGVDGGYYENSGLLSAIEISEGIATLVEE
ncbi:MAG: hypothetical protein GY773_13625, partial [Actinomycetia bacterium]|nr:hypothetical protein [Actinomycetes bacterium]